MITGDARAAVKPGRVLVALLLDAVSIVLFVMAGRSSHDEGGSFVGETARVAAPFLIAAAVGWALSRGWRRPTSLQTGVIVWITTVVGGMLLRRFVFDRGTAAAFIVVATIATFVLLLGWRYAANRLRPSV